MNSLRTLLFRLQTLFRQSSANAELDDEFAAHLDLLTDRFLHEGMSRDEAAAAARRQFGNPTLLHQQHREARTFLFFSNVWRDVTYGTRILLKSPGFTLVAALTLALAIGANTTIFSLTRQLLYERLAVPDAASLRLLAWTGTEKHVSVHHVWGDWDPLPGGRAASTAFSYPAYLQMRSQNQAFDDLFAFKRMNMIATIGEKSQQVRTEMVSGNYFSALNLRPQLGRAIQPSDDASPGQGAVTMISDEMWARVFERSAGVLGQNIKLDGVWFTVVGVSARGFTGAKDVLKPVDFFVPLAMQPVVLPHPGASLFMDSRTWWVNVMGRIRPGVSDAAAQAALDAQLTAFVRGAMPVRAGEDLPRLDLRDGSRGLFEQEKEFARPMAVLMTLVGFVLLLACANVANLMLARGAKRYREMSVRLALGAGRGRILTQMLVESLLLAALGGAGGAVAGYFGRNIVPSMLGNAWERTDFQIHFDWLVFAFTAGVTMLTGVLFGIIPALAAARAEVTHGLKESARTATRRRKGLSGKALVGFQVALSTLLVIGAGLFLRTLTQLSQVTLGFRPDHLLLAEIDPPAGRYPAGKDVALHQRLEQAFNAQPGVTSVTLAEDAFVADDRSSTDFLPAGEAYNPVRNQEEVYNVVGNRFFETMGIPLVEGRGFGPQDTAGSPRVAVINERLARSRFPGVDPIGKRFATDQHDSDGGGGPLGNNTIEVVGVCADTRYSSLRAEPPPVFFLPYVQRPHVGGLIYEIRTAVEPESVLPAIRAVVRSVDPDLALTNVRTQQQQIDADLEQERIFVTLTSGFGLLALLLAAVGIYGVMAYSVAQRTNEIGIRLALGAKQSQMRDLILGESARLAGVGILAGVVAALVLSRLVASMLYGIAASDPLTIVGGGLLLLVVALASSWIPARRAARTEPMTAIRCE